MDPNLFKELFDKIIRNSFLPKKHKKMANFWLLQYLSKIAIASKIFCEKKNLKFAQVIKKSDMYLKKNIGKISNKYDFSKNRIFKI